MFLDDVGGDLCGLVVRNIEPIDVLPDKLEESALLDLHAGEVAFALLYCERKGACFRSNLVQVELLFQLLHEFLDRLDDVELRAVEAYMDQVGESDAPLRHFHFSVSHKERDFFPVLVAAELDVD